MYSTKSIHLIVFNGVCMFYVMLVQGRFKTEQVADKFIVHVHSFHSKQQGLQPK